MIISLRQFSFACFFVRIAFLVVIRETSGVPLNIRTEGDMALLVDAASSDQTADYSSVAPPVEWTTTHSSRRRRRRSRKHGSRSDFPLDRLLRQMDDLHNRSICRWSYHDRIDENRRPHNLPYARCANATLEGLHLPCHHVYYLVPVLKKSDELGIESWERSWESVSVGCTVAHPHVHRPKAPTTA